MFSFRQKIFLSYLGVFLLFITLMFPFASKTVKDLVHHTMQMRAEELIAKIQSAQDEQDLIRRLRGYKSQIYFRIGIITDEQKVLYDTAAKRMLGPRFSQEYIVNHPEVIEAFKSGVGYNEDYSDILSQKYFYLAVAFDFHGKTYVMRTAFPHKYVTDLIHDFEIGFLLLASAVLFLFSIMTWLIIHRLSRPIQQIINDITPYEEGLTPNLPEITLGATHRKDDFARLAAILNSQSTKIGHHIETITNERDEKEAILESLIEGVIAVNRVGKITYANDTALQFLSCPERPLDGKSLRHLPQPRLSELILKCQEEDQVLKEMFTFRHQGQKVFLHAVAAPKSRGGAVLVLQDYSSYYRMLEMRKEFVANASHELKTPITVIRGFAETLHEHPDLPRDKVVRVTDKIVRNCQKMTSLIKNLMTLADIEKIPEYQLIECNLLTLVKQCLDRVVEAYPTIRVEVTSLPTADIKLVANPGLLEMALFNLIENAAKYSVDPAQVSIAVTKLNESVQVAISDKGIGMPQSDLKHIFERFYRIDVAYSKRMGGSGLGLAIVEAIVEKHLGQITVSSEVGVGTTFTISLPRQIQKML